MEKTSNWSSVWYFLSDAAFYLDGDDKETMMFRVQLSDLMDRAEYNAKRKNNV